MAEELKPGMKGAVEYGTARRASYNANEPIFGKTGTCTDQRSAPTSAGSVPITSWRSASWWWWFC